MKKVMLIGDSIRMSYQAAVRKRLADVAEVWGPDDNCRFVKYTLWNVAAWLNQCGQPDVIHWNNGIWDVYRQNQEMGIFTSLEEYAADLKRVLRELRRTGAQVIWATTTPVKPECLTCRNEDIAKYNAEAVRIMTAEQVATNDLNCLLMADLNGFISQDNVHLSEAGVEACGEAVARMILKYL
ncbi:MAG: SGNH/GDSL hydrolase family protein [Lentisphaerae bacterium]|nr:SGNH/GDSL hydrolase family protein [Lentisphaerota bacterium]